MGGFFYYESKAEDNAAYCRGMRGGGAEYAGRGECGAGGGYGRDTEAAHYGKQRFRGGSARKACRAGRGA